VLLAIAAKRVDSKLAAEVGFGDTTGVGVGVTTGVGVGDATVVGAGFGVTTGVGVSTGIGVFFREDVYVRPLKSKDPGNQNLQRSEVPSGTSPTVHG
jgi:tetrahydrodipicolinate N-succinyltransferase